MDKPLTLLPPPRQALASPGVFTLADGKLIQISGVRVQQVRSSIERLLQVLHEYNVDWQMTASLDQPAVDVALTLQVNPAIVPQPQGYRLAIGPDGIQVAAHDQAGVFYAICTLIQVLQQSGVNLPCLSIEDWPDFLNRGVMLDISRDKVYSMETLFELVDLLASWKINQVQLYTEHTFAYRNHPEVWQSASPMTAQEIIELDAYCLERQVELVPNQNSFGHMARWLKFPRYQPLAEIVGKFTCPWGEMEGPFSLAPEDPGSFALIQSLYDELLPNFGSSFVNVGCDETVDLGAGRSKEAVAVKGAGRVYLDFLLKIYQDVRRRGRTMMFWGDIIIQHPDLVPALPKDSIALEWGYDADHPFDEHGAAFAASGIPFYVCPGTSSWNTIAGRTDNALGNLRSAAENGIKYGACGYLNTDWGDNGHMQVLPVSYLGFAAGAAYSWNCKGTPKMDLPRALSLFAFADPSEVMGQLYYDLGNMYREVGLEPRNSSSIFITLLVPLDEIRNHPEAGKARFERALKAIDDAAPRLNAARMVHPKADLLRRETLNTIQLLRHGCKRGLLAMEKDPAKAAEMKAELLKDMREFLVKFKAVWLERNRLGGLSDSAARLEKLQAEYEG